ncbi:aminotransferase class I/II-fold pyridoxal phosphate-dependent enzyme [Clostridium sp. MSJ-8]|uniref:pyridoxal phosphate-dependent aminotransferase n=1 Tax=Clostridium sp. MSJ-8 TaxID=2841510 RepID=UPI001C0F1582|nr:aminotransferase class I/II-fold pyridoxal phosphate-dependent enzyme [Clostridium sp. MSJ-8]MBU5488047.1 aminotransferase class I/II-fold pyridoxal phosphate-dependent enzyme [Clostridium sp. MSJ-8]
MIPEKMIRKNVLEMPPSGIRKYFDLINEMDDAISLGVGEPDFLTPWNVTEAGIYSLEQGNTHYSSNAGYIELREEIAKYLQRYNLYYNPTDEIIVTVGGSEGIDIALRALVGPGDEVIIPEPSFVAYKGCTAFTGATSVTIDLKQENEFKLTAEQLEAAITDRTKVVIMPFPNNPTGAVMTREELEPIVEVLKDKDIVVISDEIYSELNYGEEEHVSIASFEEMRDRTLVVNGFSKSYAMTGWRLGYLCGNKEFISQMKKIHQYAIMCSPTTAQYAALEALKHSRESVDKMVREYNRRRRLLFTGFKEMGLECFEPLGAFYMFPCIKSTGLTSEEFCEKLLVEEKVLVIPGTAFGECGEGYVRACYASSTEDIIEAIKRMKAFVERYRK